MIGIKGYDVCMSFGPFAAKWGGSLPCLRPSVCVTCGMSARIGRVHTGNVPMLRQPNLTNFFCLRRPCLHHHCHLAQRRVFPQRECLRRSRVPRLREVREREVKGLGQRERVGKERIEQDVLVRPWLLSTSEAKSRRRRRCKIQKAIYLSNLIF